MSPLLELTHAVKETDTVKRSSLRRGAIALGLLLAFIAPANWALAGSSGGIAGTVSDAKTGSPIPGVQLKISSPSDAANVTTDAKGHFVVFSLQPDSYTITLQRDGYYSRTVSGYTINADQTQQCDLTLTPSPARPSGSGG
jgi:hypothetical protein